MTNKNDKKSELQHRSKKKETFLPEISSILSKKRKRVTFAPDGLLEKVKLFVIMGPEDSDDETKITTTAFSYHNDNFATPTFSGRFKTISSYSIQKDLEKSKLVLFLYTIFIF
jgi:hypothetical protein